MNTYKDLFVWQRAMQLVTVLYQITKQFPREEMYGLTAQMRRSAISIPSNIAEGRRRGSRKDFRQFLIIAFASGAELETQIQISKNLGYIENRNSEVDDLLLEVMKMLNKILETLKPT